MFHHKHLMTREALVFLSLFLSLFLPLSFFWSDGVMEFFASELIFNSSKYKVTNGLVFRTEAKD